MLFEKSVTVLTTHTSSARNEQVMGIAHGIITWVSVFFPPGCHNTVHCTIHHHEHQVFPSTAEMSIVGNAGPVEWTEYYKSYQPPYELKIKAWGDSCSYDHTIVVRIAILPREAVLALAIVDAIKSAFGLLSPKRIFTGS